MKLLIVILTISLCYSQTKDISKYINMSIEDLMKLEVTTVSKKGEGFKNTAGIVSLITKNEIVLFGARNLFDVIEKTVGVLPYNAGSVGTNIFSIRGDKPLFNNNHVLILLNGAPLSLESYTGGIWNQAIINSIPINSIQQIEIVRGPSSALYGSTAFTGVINIITLTEENNIEVNYGNFSSIHYKSSHYFGTEKINGQINLNYFNTDGNNLEAKSHNSSAVYSNTYEKNIGAIASFNYKKTMLDIFYGSTNQFSLRQTGLSNFIYFNNGHIENTKLNISLSSKTMYKNWQIKPLVTYGYGKSLLDPPDIGNFTIDYNTKDIHSEITATREFSSSHYLMIGSAFKKYSGETTTAVPKWGLTSWNFFSNYFVKVAPTVNFFVGGQYNREHDKSTNFVPRVGFTFDKGNWNGKVIYSESFRSPYQVEKKANFPFIKGNPNVESEKNSNFDFNVSYKLGDTYLSLTLFDSHMKDLIIRGFLPNSLNRSFINAAVLHIRGLEFEHKFTIHNKYYTTFSYFYQENHNAEGIDNTTLQPSHHIKAGFGYSENTFSMGVFTTLISPYKDSNIINPNRLKTHREPHWSYNTSLNFKYNINDYTISFYIKNLFNQKIFVSDIYEVNNTLPSFDQERRLFFGLALNL